MEVLHLFIRQDEKQADVLVEILHCILDSTGSLRADLVTFSQWSSIPVAAETELHHAFQLEPAI